MGWRGVNSWPQLLPRCPLLPAPPPVAAGIPPLPECVPVFPDVVRFGWSFPSSHCPTLALCQVLGTQKQVGK